MSSLLNNLPIKTIDITKLDTPCKSAKCFPPSFGGFLPMLIVADMATYQPMDWSNPSNWTPIDIVALGVPLCANAINIQAVARPANYAAGPNYLNIASGNTPLYPSVFVGLTSRINTDEIDYAPDRTNGVLPVDLNNDPNIYIVNRATNGGATMTDVGIGISGYWY